MAGDYWCGLTLARDGALTDDTVKLRASTMLSMQLCVRLACPAPPPAELEPLKQLHSFAQATGCSTRDLHHRLLMLLLSSLCRLAALAADAQLEFNELEPPRAAELLESNDFFVWLPCIATLDDESRAALEAMLTTLHAFDLTGFCRGEAVVGTLAPLRKLSRSPSSFSLSSAAPPASPAATALSSGAHAARQVLLHESVHALAAAHHAALLVTEMPFLPWALGELVASEQAWQLQLALTHLDPFLRPGSTVSEADVFRSFLRDACGDPSLSDAHARLVLMSSSTSHTELRTPASRATLVAEAMARMQPLRLRALEQELGCPSGLRPIVPAGANDLLLEHFTIAIASGGSPPDALASGLVALESVYRAARASLSGGTRGPLSGAGGLHGGAHAPAADELGADSSSFKALSPFECRCENAVRAVRSLFDAVRIAVPDASTVEAAALVVESAARDATQEVARDDSRFSILYRSPHAGYIVANGNKYRSDEWNVLPDEKSKTTLRARLASVTKAFGGARPLPLVVFADPGRDADDELALCLSKATEALGLFELKLVYTGLEPAAERARLARGTLDAVALMHVPVVGVGVERDDDVDDDVDDVDDDVDACAHGAVGGLMSASIARAAPSRFNGKQARGSLAAPDFMAFAREAEANSSRDAAARLLHTFEDASDGSLTLCAPPHLASTADRAPPLDPESSISMRTSPPLLLTDFPCTRLFFPLCNASSFV